MALNVPCRKTACIQAQDFVVEALQSSLALGHQLRRKAPVAVTRDHQGQRPGVRLDRLLALAVAHVGGIAQVGSQLGFQHPLNDPLGQALQ